MQRSASLYRQLATSAIAGLRATGHRADQIWLGETAPLGDDPSGCSAQRSLRVPKKCAAKILKTSPETFLRGVFCLNTKGRKLTGAEASDQKCGGYKKLNVTGYAHHPYTRGGSRPPTSRVNAGEITINVASRLTRLLDNAAKAKRIPSKLPIHYTEHGWQTKPDLIFGVTDAQQADYINQSDWIAYKNPRVHTVAQYKIVDDRNIGAGFQMGLRLLTGAAKPAYQAYKLPIWVSGKGADVTVYGQVRPADNGTAQTVDIQVASGAGAAFKTVQSVPVTTANGIFTAKVPNSGAAVALVLERNHVSPSGGVAQVRRALALLTVMTAMVAIAATPAHAADFELGMEDEGLLLNNPHCRRRRRHRLEDTRRRRGPHPRALVGDRTAGQRRQEALGLQREGPRRRRLQLGRARRRRQHGARGRDAGDAHDHGAGPAVGLDRASQAQPALDPERGGLRGLRAGGRHALPLAGGSLPDLERAQPAGLAAAAVAVRQAPPELHGGLAARLPVAGARRRPGDPRRRSRVGGRDG